MKRVRVTPLWYEMDRGTSYLVSRVDFFGYDRMKRPKLWFSAPDVTVEQLCDAVASKFHAQTVDFQPPLLPVGDAQFHAGDFRLAQVFDD